MLSVVQGGLVVLQLGTGFVMGSVGGPVAQGDEDLARMGLLALEL